MSNPEKNSSPHDPSHGEIAAIDNLLMRNRPSEARLVQNKAASPTEWLDVARNWYAHGFTAMQVSAWVNGAKCYQAEPAARLRDAGVFPEQAGVITAEGEGGENFLGYKFFKGQIGFEEAVRLALAQPTHVTQKTMEAFVVKGMGDTDNAYDYPAGPQFFVDEIEAKLSAALAAPGLEPGTVYTARVPEHDRFLDWDGNFDDQSEKKQELVLGSLVLRKALHSSLHATMQELFGLVAKDHRDHRAEILQGWQLEHDAIVGRYEHLGDFDSAAVRASVLPADRRRAEELATLIDDSERTNGVLTEGDLTAARAAFLAAGIAGYYSREDCVYTAGPAVSALHYVVFNPSHISVTHSNGKEVTPEQAKRIQDELAAEAGLAVPAPAPAPAPSISPYHDDSRSPAAADATAVTM